MTSVSCPYCDNQFRIAQPKTGKFKPTCKSCGKSFALAMKVEGDQVRTRAYRLEDVKTKLKPGKQKSAETESQIETRVDPDPDSVTPLPSALETSVPPVERTRAEIMIVTTAADEVIDESSGSVIDTRPAEHPFTAPPLPQKLGGYKIIRELGRGGLGVVYLARQISLDRPVALKTILGKISKDSAAISRFNREAYAAAQLVHHNVIQIYDLGRDGETNFFSMEFVPGQNLSQLVKHQGPLDPEKAASLILQAARGLHFAHNQGMVHRDVKPANLMLSDQGVVKVADLGLVKLAGDEAEARERGFEELAKLSSEELTMAGYALGTANYMAPEQADNSALVDHRADIYSLGCSLYVLLTGRPPFRGTSAIEVISKHRTEPLVRPEQIVDRVDDRLSDIVVKMVAKRPEDRYLSLSKVIDDLETYLGISTADVLNPAREQVALLQDSQKKYYGLPLAKLRNYAAVAFIGLCLVGLLILSFIGWRWASGIFSLASVTPLAYFLIKGFKDRGVAFEKVRDLAARAGWRRWVQAALVFLLIVVVLFVAKLLTIWTVFAVFGIAIAALFYFAVDGETNKGRSKSLQPVEAYLTEKRLAGVDEHSLQRFVAKYSGKDWEEYFEDLFGYPAMRRARLELATGELGGKRKRSRPVRDLIIDRIDGMLEEEKQKDDRQKLQRVEKEALVAAGMDEAQAEQQAAEFAGALVKEAAQWRSAAVDPANATRKSPTDSVSLAAQKRARIKAMLADARSGKYRKQKSTIDQLEGPLDLLLGSHVRFILGTLLIIGCALWIRQNGILDTVSVESVVDAAKSAVKQGSVDVEAVADEAGIVANETEALNVPIIGGWFTGFGPGLAGLLLVISAFFRGWRMSLFLIPAALIAWLGPALGVPGFGSLLSADAVSIAIGGVIALIGFVFGRSSW